VRGADQQTGHLFSHISPEQRVPSDHPLRPIREMVDAALRGLSPTCEAMYSWTGRPSVPPEQVLRALYRYIARPLILSKIQAVSWTRSLPCDPNEPKQPTTAARRACVDSPRPVHGRANSPAQRSGTAHLNLTLLSS
jgi:hypothetical protein